MSTMNIAMLTDVYKPVINGVTNFISLCQREMENSGHKVTIFTFGTEGSEDGDKRVMSSPAVPISDTGYHLSLDYSREARNKLNEMDVLHVHHPFISGRLANRYGRQLNLPVIFTCHTRYDLYLQSYFPHVPLPVADKLFTTFMRSYVAQCDMVVAPSAGMEQVLRDIGVVRPIPIIPNGIDLDRLSYPETRLSRAELNIPDDGTVLIYVGRLGPEKNLDFLIQAFAGAAEALSDAYLVLVGGGPSKSDLEKLARDVPRVRFVDQVPYDQVPAYLAVGDVFVTASVTEVHPLSVIEALAAGLPVVAIRSPGLSDTVRHGVDGYLARHDLAAFTAMMVRLLMEPSRRLEMAANARARSARYDIRTTADAYLAQYERLIHEVEGRPPKEKLWRALAREVQHVFSE